MEQSRIIHTIWREITYSALIVWGNWSWISLWSKLISINARCLWYNYTRVLVYWWWCGYWRIWGWCVVLGSIRLWGWQKFKFEITFFYEMIFFFGDSDMENPWNGFFSTIATWKILEMRYFIENCDIKNLRKANLRQNLKKSWILSGKFHSYQV